MLRRADLFPEAWLPDVAEVMVRGRARAEIAMVHGGAFLTHYGVASEAQYKRDAMAAGRIMQHAQIGYRDLAKSQRAWREIHEVCAERNVRVDRYGICLDWTMGLPRALRAQAPAGTGLILRGAEDFAALTAMAPVAPHFGDFVLGFPAALENTEAALLAGATAIGNLGQYFMFRLPGWDDDVASTTATVEALALIAAQPREVLIHSNLDDGFAAIFSDLASVLGMALIEQYVIEDLIGGRMSHCWGHHFTDPVARLAFHLALAGVSRQPGTMIYGNTVLYQGNAAENYASLACYLGTDIQGQLALPTGHAINPVPVTENSRIPDIEEVIDAQLFAGRMVALAQGQRKTLDLGEAQRVATRIADGGRKFAANVLAGLARAGVDTGNAFEMLLALKRLGPKRLEQLFGVGPLAPESPGGRAPVVASSLIEEIAQVAQAALGRAPASDLARVRSRGLSVIVASTDVHEHGKLALEQVLRALNITVIDGGVSVDAEALAARAGDADAILVSTYNGVALGFFRRLSAALQRPIPILIGGRLNQVPEGSNTSLPVDVTAELAAEGAIICTSIEAAVPVLANL